ncbi:MAG: hypothetical protein N2Z72_02230 [Bacteroidales bacterium]|nr:hypothetical protein [Bacteroidales bacterium]
MKNIFIWFFSFLLFANQIYSQSVMRDKAKNVINRTAFVIYTAHKATVAHKVYTGNLQRALLHQKIAIKMYTEEKYGKAIAHSIRARELAIRHILTNNEQIPQGYEILPDERVPMDENTNRELDDEANTFLKQNPVLSDKELSEKPLSEKLEVQ